MVSSKDSKAASRDKELAPEDRPVGALHAKRLAAMSKISAKEIAGKTVKQLADKFRFKINPELLLFRRVCGRVVKTDPVTGEQRPVPFATVHVEDTDCHFLAYFPHGWRWHWLYPYHCHREAIATATTDECGRFCVYIPRWDIDWILRWRKLHLCFPIIFERPNLGDLLDELRPHVPDLPRPPRPQPDPVPWLLEEGGQVLRRVEDFVGARAAGDLAIEAMAPQLGASTLKRTQLLEGPAFPEGLAAPLPDHIKEAAEQGDEKRLAKMLDLDVKHIRDFHHGRFIGPFRRCFDIYVPEWQRILDVPDITFRVTQDIDGDGDEETIYSEGHFEVRWNAGAIGDVTLEASPSALAGVSCDQPPVVCGNVPAITFAGLMPLTNPPAPAAPYHDNLGGYAARPNRPHPSGRIAPVASDFPLPQARAPYAKSLQIYGCPAIGKAKYYRVTFQHNGGPVTPFTGLSWPVYRLAGGVLQTQWRVADSQGWYPVLNPADGWSHDNMLLDWPSGSYAGGLYTLRLETADAGKNLLATSDPVNMRVDNSAPSAQFNELRWRVAGGGWSAPVSLICPVVHRPVIGGHPADLEFRLSYQASAQHLRHVKLTGGGCGGGAPVALSAASTTEHWHQSSGDNAFAATATFGVAGASAQGAYSFHIYAASRAFNPSGASGGLSADWFYDPTVIHIWRTLPVAIVNA